MYASFLNYPCTYLVTYCGLNNYFKKATDNNKLLPQDLNMFYEFPFQGKLLNFNISQKILSCLTFPFKTKSEALYER